MRTYTVSFVVEETIYGEPVRGGVGKEKVVADGFYVDDANNLVFHKESQVPPYRPTRVAIFKSTNWVAVTLIEENE